MSKVKVARLVGSVTAGWNYFQDRLFRLRDDILSMEALRWRPCTSDEHRIHHRAIADYWNEIAPKHGIRLKMNGDWPAHEFDWNNEPFWEAFRTLGVEDILNHWAAEESKKPKRRKPGDLYQRPPLHSPESERQFLGHYLAGFIRYWAIEFPALRRAGIEHDEEQRSKEGRYSRFHWVAAEHWEKHRHTKRGQQWLDLTDLRDKYVPPEKRRHYRVVDIVAGCLKHFPRGYTGRTLVPPPAEDPLQRINPGVRLSLKAPVAMQNPKYIDGQRRK